MKNAPKQKAFESASGDADSTTTKVQRKKLLAALQVAPITTIEARRDLDIMMPAARIHELRHKLGYVIDLVWTMQQTDNGKLHRVARYVLKASEAKS